MTSLAFQKGKLFPKSFPEWEFSNVRWSVRVDPSSSVLVLLAFHSSVLD